VGRAVENWPCAGTKGARVVRKRPVTTISIEAGMTSAKPDRFIVVAALKNLGLKEWVTSLVGRQKTKGKKNTILSARSSVDVAASTTRTEQESYELLEGMDPGSKQCWVWKDGPFNWLVGKKGRVTSSESTECKRTTPVRESRGHNTYTTF